MTQGSFAPLDSICNVEYGTRVVQKHDGGSIYPVYGGGGATFKMDTFNRQDRLVIARFAMSEVCTRFVKGPFYLNDSGLTVSPKGKGLLPKFLDYQLLSKTNEIYALGKGSAQRNLDVPAFRDLPIFIPHDTESQLKIISILDKAFTEIATAKANAEKNLQNASALFESYLIKVFTEQGDGWVQKELGDLCDFLNGYAFKSGDAVQSSLTQLVRMGNLYGNKLDLERNPVFYPDQFINDYSRFTLHPGDLIMSLTGTTGKEDYGFVVQVPKTSYKLLLNQRIVKFDSIKECLVCKDYLLHYLRSRVFLDVLYPTANGTRQANLSTVSMKTLPVPVCNMPEQLNVVSKLNALAYETQRLESIYQQKLAALDELKQSLLHQAFSGAL